MLRAYDNIDCSQDFNRLNFEPVDFIYAKGEVRREVRMTKDGFMFLAMVAKPLIEAKAKGQQGERTDIRQNSDEGATPAPTPIRTDEAVAEMGVSGKSVTNAVK